MLLKGDNMQEKDKSSVHLEYSVSNDEENIAFKEFQKKYVRNKNILKTVLFLLALALFIQQVYKKNDYTIGWACIGICVAAIFFIWYNPVKIRKNLMKALREIENDVYAFDLYEDHFTISTIYCEENDSADTISDIEEKAESEEEEKTEIKPRDVYFNQINVDVVEIEEMFIIFLKKETLYVIPKRLISTKDAETMRKIFSQNIGEDFKIKSR